jgi:2-dehydro-3-deoxyphosphogluconate aldolase/(4S)-4-hydroxy-2-oxoglutarate aldolase
MPTGGVGLDDIDAYKKAGADGYGIGTPLFMKQLIDEKNWDALKEHFQRFVNKVTTKL